MTYGVLENGEVIATLVAPMDFLSNQPTRSGDALSLKRTVTVSPAQRWELETRLMPQTWDANRLLVHFTVRGRHKKYQIIVPQSTGVIAQRTPTSSVHTCSGTAGSDVLSVFRWAGYAPEGTFIRFSNHSKIYMLVEPLQPGSTTVTVYPSLRVNVSGDTFKHQDDVIMDAWLDTDNVRGMRYTDGILQDLGTVKFVEAL